MCRLIKIEIVFNDKDDNSDEDSDINNPNYDDDNYNNFYKTITTEG